MGESETEMVFVLIKIRTPTVYAKCEGNPWCVSSWISGSRYTCHFLFIILLIIVVCHTVLLV